MLKSLLGVFFFSFTNGLNLVQKNNDHKFSSFESGENTIKNNPNKLNDDLNFNQYNFYDYIASDYDNYVGVDGVQFSFNYLSFKIWFENQNLFNKDLHSRNGYVFSFDNEVSLGRIMTKSSSPSTISTLYGFIIYYNVGYDELRIYNDRYISSNNTFYNSLGSNYIIYEYSNGRENINFFDNYIIKGLINYQNALTFNVLKLKTTVGGFNLYSLYHGGLNTAFNISLDELYLDNEYVCYGGYFNGIDFLSKVLPVKWQGFILNNNVDFGRLYANDLSNTYNMGVVNLTNYPVYGNGYQDNLVLINNDDYSYNVLDSLNAVFVNNQSFSVIRAHFKFCDGIFFLLDENGYVAVNGTFHQPFAYIDYVYATNQYGDKFVLYECLGMVNPNTEVFGYVPNKYVLKNYINSFYLLFEGEGTSVTIQGNKYTLKDILGYQGYYSGSGNGYLNESFTLINTALGGFVALFGLTILPGITIGALVLVPLLGTILIFVIKLFKR